MRGGLACGLFMLAFAAVASAQDDCLTGASTLGDQRALAALRDAVDAACPCQPPGSATARREYARCTRDEIRSALEGGTLRRECARSARQIYRSATCGTNRVPCGVPPDAGETATCRRAAPTGHNACDRPGENACSESQHCSDVVDATAGTCIDPRHFGPYGVGVRTVHMTKDSVAMPGTERVLDTIVWYPTTAGAGPVDNQLKGVIDAPLDNSGGPYPLLMFSHGSCGYAFQSTFLTPLLASYGLVVAAPPHPGNTIFEFPTCSMPQSLASSALERPADIIYAADQLLAAAADNSSPFFDAIDPQRMGMSGHSFGGFTTYVVANRDSRFRIAVPMAPAVPASQAHLSVPSLSMMSELDSYVNNPAIDNAYAASNAPKMKVELEHTGHFAYSDGCFPSPDCNPPTTLTQNEAHALVQRWVVPFVLRYLKGDARFEPFLEAAPPPGVVVASEGISGP
jgi:dienelactone hydrolase